MLKGDLCSIECRIEASCRRMSRHYNHRALTVASVKSLVKVSLLCLCRDTCRRAGTLNVDNDKRKLGHDSKSESLRLEGKTWTRCCSNCKISGEGSTYGCTDTGDLILCLKSLCSKALMDSEFLKDTCRRSDRI